MISSDAARASSPLAAQETSTRRKSGRVVRKPDLFTQTRRESSPLSSASSKRKRQPNGHAFLGQDDEISEDEGSPDDGEESVDDEELKEKKRRARNNGTNPKQSTKRPRISNGTGAALAIRPAKAQSKKAPQRSKVQNARSRQSQLNQEGLYAEIFGRGQSGEDAAAAWFQRYQQSNVDAMCEMVNLVLQCTGCEARITSHDIEDMDNVTNKLGDLQGEYQETPIVDYPLLSKHKDYAAFRPVLVDFFSALIKTIHHSSSLYEDSPLFENIQTWVDTMSSAAIRPFRHTATLISLTMSSALCQIARDLELAISMSRRQAETESRRKKVNQARVSSIQQKTAADEEKLATIESILKDEFDLVFVHRYRDVDPKIRVECVAAIGNWILTYRKMFLEGQYLRYLGWVLSDTVAQTRSEVIKQLRLLFKNPANVGPLRGFTDRFRPRMVEIAARDAEAGVRADTIELLDKLRDAELLEPDDIDTVGQLIFDSEPRVRKAVGKFFVSNLEDLHKVNIEPIDYDQYDASLPTHHDIEDYLSPSRSWIKFKCLAESLGAYDRDSQESHVDRPANMLIAANMESRYMLATQAIFPHMDELQEWESLAGYLLYDHSSITSATDDPDTTAAIQTIYKLEEGEESILLEVLDYAVKLYLIANVETQPVTKRKGGRRTQADKDHIQETQETAARHLTAIIPQLLNKYGSVPQAASSILRLQHLLDVDLLDDLQTPESTYSALLDDVNQQFMSHSDRAVLAEASVSLLKAKVCESAKEAVDTKMQDMWEDMLGTLRALCENQNLEARGTLSGSLLTEISNTMCRLSNLASISDCAVTLATVIPSPMPPKGRKNRAPVPIPLDLLFQLCRRGKADEEVDEDVSVLEDDLVTSVIKTILFYFMWSIQSLRASMSANSVRYLEQDPDLLADLACRRDDFAEILSTIAVSRSPLDRIRLLSLSTTMDLYSLFSTLRHVKPSKESQQLPPTVRRNIDEIVSAVPAISQGSIIQTHDRLERLFARKSRRKLAPSSDQAHQHQQQREPAEDDLPIDSDSDENEDGGEPNGDDDDNDDDEAVVGDLLGQGRDARKAATLLAEQHLCEFTGKLVLAVLAEIVTATSSAAAGGVATVAVEDSTQKLKERLLRNKLKLGPNYKEVLSYLQEPKEKKRRKTTTTTATATATTTGSGNHSKKQTTTQQAAPPNTTTGSNPGAGQQRRNDAMEDHTGKPKKSELLILSDDDEEEDIEDEDEDEDQANDDDDIEDADGDGDGDGKGQIQVKPSTAPGTDTSTTGGAPSPENQADAAADDDDGEMEDVDD